MRNDIYVCFFIKNVIVTIARNNSAQAVAIQIHSSEKKYGIANIIIIWNTNTLLNLICIPNFIFIVSLLIFLVYTVEF
jgi:hypothetical protein